MFIKLYVVGINISLNKWWILKPYNALKKCINFDRNNEFLSLFKMDHDIHDKLPQTPMDKESKSYLNTIFKSHDYNY